MRGASIIWISTVFLCTVTLTTGWNDYAISQKYQTRGKNSDDTILHNDTRYCFHFTWMGGNYNNRTFRNIMNKTCSQHFRNKDTLCINPMVATYTGGEPDLKYLLHNHSRAATCRLLQQQVCAKYTFYHNGIVSYITRYCTQIHVNLEGPMQTGCLREKRGADVVEVCACTSEPGPDGICNSSRQIISNLAILATYSSIWTFWYLAS